MKLEDFGKNHQAFEIRAIQPGDLDLLNKSTIDLTVRNMTKRIPSNADEDCPSSDRQRADPGRDGQTTVQEADCEEEEDTQTQINEEEILNNWEEPAEEREKQMRALSAAIRNQKLLLVLLLPSFFAHFLTIAGFYDTHRALFYGDLISGSCQLVLSIQLGIFLFRKNFRQNSNQFLLNTLGKYRLSLTVLFFVQACNCFVFSALELTESSVEMSRNMSSLLLIGLMLCILIHMIVKKIKIRTSVAYLCFNIGLLAFYLNAVFQEEKIARLDNGSLFWPYYVCAGVLFVLLALSLFDCLLAAFKYFLSLIHRSLFLHSILKAFALIHTIGWLFGIAKMRAIDEQPDSGFFLILSQVILFACFGIQVAIVALYKYSLPLLTADLKELLETQERINQENRVKIKAEVPIYLRKRKSDSYFQKVGKEEIGTIRIKTEPKIQESNEKPIAKKVKDFNLPRLSGTDQKFRINYPSQSRTFRVNSKQEVTLLQGLQRSLRKFVSQRPAEKEIFRPRESTDSQRERMIQTKENETNSHNQSQITLSVNEMSKDQGRQITDTGLDIKQAQEILVESLSRRKREGVRKEETPSQDCCLICYENKSAVIIMPCGHSELCIDCAKDIWSAKGLCFLCQNAIKYMLVVEEVTEDIYKVAYSLYLKNQ